MAGSPVAAVFNGLVVGEVTRIKTRLIDPRQIYVIVKGDQPTPLRTDTRARIEAKGFAGVVADQFLGGDASSPALTTLRQHIRHHEPWER